MISITPEIASNEFESISKLILSFSNIVYDFNDDGTYTSTINSFLSDNTETGTWSISDDNKILTLDNENMNIHQLDKTYLKISTENSFIDNEDINELETGFLTITFATVEDDEE
jgi:hypothetical protein